MIKINVPKTISFCGLAFSGKTTAAKILQQFLASHDIDSTILPMAGPLKNGLAIMGITKESHPKIYRDACQYVGTEIVRNYEKNWWVNLHKRHSDTIVGKVILVEDIRFDNEVDAILNYYGGQLFFMDALNSGRTNLDNPIYSHESEKFAMSYYQSTIPDIFQKIHVIPNHTNSIFDLERYIQNYFETQYGVEEKV